jgi:hypothetical protein
METLNEMTPDPKGFPHTSPLHQCVPSKPLTDKRIEQLCLRGWYGTARQKYYQSLERGKQLLKQKTLSKIQQTIRDLTS